MALLRTVNYFADEQRTDGGLSLFIRGISLGTSGMEKYPAYRTCNGLGIRREGLPDIYPHYPGIRRTTRRLVFATVHEHASELQSIGIRNTIAPNSFLYTGCPIAES